MEVRRAEAKRRIIGWRAVALAGEARVSIALPDAPATDILFAELSDDLQEIGVTLERASSEKSASPKAACVSADASTSDTAETLRQAVQQKERAKATSDRSKITPVILLGARC